MVLQEPFISRGGARCEKLENQCPRGQYYSSCSHVLKINDHSTNPCTPGGTLQLFNKQHQVKHINSESTAELKPHSLNACGFCGAAVMGKSSSSFWGCLLVYRPNPLSLKCTLHVIGSCECTQLPVCGTVLIEFSWSVWGCKSILIKVYQVYSGPGTGELRGLEVIWQIERRWEKGWWVYKSLREQEEEEKEVKDISCKLKRLLCCLELWCVRCNDSIHLMLGMINTHKHHLFHGVGLLVFAASCW